ncbi:glycosyltransferase family 4 protein [Cytobacillus firmus]|uniref:glycosyltransferase family 4 protein n=1 Tax=Cytobacillus firmus TaxID=1399 RepID=UPI00369E0A45
MKKNIIVIGPYIPGKSYGGPVKSVLNIVETLSDKFNFYVITGDRDLNSQNEYTDVKIGSWNQIGRAKVFYVPKGKDLKYLNKLLKEINYDLIYANSFFAKHSVIVQFLRYFNIIKKPLIVAPRGEFSPGALAIKSTKKKVFLSAYKLLKLHRKLSFSSTSLTDKQDILNTLGNSLDITVAGNIANKDLDLCNPDRKKNVGELNIVSVSRISKIKNIDYSLQLLKKLADNGSTFKEINFDIYGPLEDIDYWDKCLSIISSIKSKVNVNYRGAIEYDKVVTTLSNYHIFLLPTKGENFGHVILEALLAGCPVIISDQTPWNNLDELDIGYDIPLNRQDNFINAIKEYLYMDEKSYRLVSTKAYEYGVYKVDNQLSIMENIEMFNSVIQKWEEDTSG